jgi:hypothetical protein
MRLLYFERAGRVIELEFHHGSLLKDRM